MTSAWERLDKDMVRAVMHRIRSGPEEFDMATFGSFVGKAALCSTACCIAGEAVLVDNLRRGMTPAAAVMDLVADEDVGDRAATLLFGLGMPGGDGLGMPGGDLPLFYESLWPRAYKFWLGTKGRALRLLQDMIDGTVEYDEHTDNSWWEPFAVNREAVS